VKKLKPKAREDEEAEVTIKKKHDAAPEDTSESLRLKKPTDKPIAEAETEETVRVEEEVVPAEEVEDKPNEQKLNSRKRRRQRLLKRNLLRKFR